MNSRYDWRPAGQVTPAALVETRRVLHLAAQSAANLGRSYLDAPADYSHISLQWDERLGALLGQAVRMNGGTFRPALRFEPLQWLLLDGSGDEPAALPLAGRTLAGLEQDIHALLTGYGFDASRYTLKPPFEVDPHALLKGAPFPADGAAARRELAGYYSGADRVLKALAAEMGVAGGPRCWPHHFDYALLHVLGGSGEEVRSIGLGLSPGDHDYPEPYFYATPWPYPGDVALPALLPPAAWHTRGWTGAVLRAADLPQHAGAALGDYWRRAHAILENLLEKASPP